MSQTQQLITIISNVLQSQNATLRKQSQNFLVSLRNDKPNELMYAYLEILKSPTAPLECRNFSGSQLRLCLSDFAPSTYTNLWQKLTPQLQEQIKKDLFVAIYNENDLNMKRHIADTIGEIAGSIIAKNDGAWPQFKTYVWNLLQDQNINSVFAGFYILESFLSYASQHFKDYTHDLFGLFKLGLCHQNGKLKISALRCFEAYLQVLDLNKHAKFQELILDIYKAVFDLIKINNQEEGLEVLSEMLEVQPKFFKKSYKQLVELLTSIFKLPEIEGGVRRMTTQILVDFVEKSPGLFRKKKQVLQATIEMIFYHMIEISSQITQEWMKPEQGYNDDMEDDEDFQTTRFGMGAIDRLIYTVGEEEMLPILSATIQQLLTNKDWRYKYTAVMALSQIGEYIQDVDKITSVLNMIVSFIKHENPMMRYAACHAIGQISDDMQPKFQQKFGGAIFPELLALLQTDQVPRVVSHSAAALTNFLQGMKFQQIQSHFDILVQQLLALSLNGISLVKESALSAISSTVEIAKQKFQPYLESTLNILFGYYTNEFYNPKAYKQLKGQAIQTLTIIASSVGPDMFRPAAIQLIELMIRLQSSEFEQTDPQKSYILAGWQRLCLVYGKQLGVYLDKILPGLFILVQNVIKQQIDFLNDDAKDIEKLDDQNINTHDTEEAEVAISMLNVFIEQLKQLYNPYVQKTVNLLCNIIKEHPNQDVKEQACKCLPNLIIAVKADESLAINLAKLFMATLVETMGKEYDSQIIIVELQTLKNVLEQLNLCFLNEQQIKDFSQKMLNLLKSADEKKVLNKQSLNQDLDEEQKQMVGQQIQQQQQVQVAISQLIGALFKTHKNMTLGLANFLIYNILPKVFIENQSQNMLKFGIFLIDDIVQFLGFELLPQQWVSFSTVLLKYAGENSCVLRQAACYGLGIFAEKTPSHILNSETLRLWLNALLEAVKIPKGNEKEKTYGHCRDNGIASIGKIIKAHFSILEPKQTKQYLSIWQRFLPLKHDKDQGMTQNQFLIDLMAVQPDFILGNDKIPEMVRVLTIYAQIVGNKKLYNQAIAAKLKVHIATLYKDPFFESHTQQIWGALSLKSRENITSFMK